MQNTKKKRTCFSVCFTAAAVLMFFAGCFGSCDVYSGGSTSSGNSDIGLSVASWNVQALFDGHDDGIEYDEFREGSGWTEEKYVARLNNIAKAVSLIGDKPPDLIALLEVENAGVMETLCAGFLAKQGYKYSFFAGNQNYALGIGALSKIPLSKATAHSINVEGSIIPRPVMELWVESDGLRIVVFVCHWKSKLGGEETTEQLRREAAKVIVRRQQELAAEQPDVPIIIMGDLNENYNEFYRHDSEYICALLPDDPEAARKTGFAIPETDENTAGETVLLSEVLSQDFLILSNEKPPESTFFSISNSAGVFYSPWGNEINNGSYYYEGSWETIDHILLNSAFFGKTGFQFKNCYVIDREPFVNSKGEPDRYYPKTGSGLSDHLPLLLTLSHPK